MIGIETAVNGTRAKPAARVLREWMGGEVVGAPSVTFGATSLKEGGQGQQQNQHKTQCSVFDLALALPLPPALREGAAQQPGGSAPRPVALLSRRDVSLWVLA
jgi:hypothetical protein